MSYAPLRGLAVALFGVFAAACAAQPDGKAVFAKRCSGCHGMDTNKEGPLLSGVIGRKAGTVAGFPYSDALRKSGITWNASLVNQWLANPEALVMDNDMDFHVADAGEREAIVSYLQSLGTQPAAN